MSFSIALLPVGNWFSNASSLPLAEMTGGAISVAWGLVLFCIILGLLVTLAPSRRTTEIKRSKDE